MSAHDPIHSDEITPGGKCPICPMLATDRDDALAEADTWRAAHGGLMLAVLRAVDLLRGDRADETLRLLNDVSKAPHGPDEACTCPGCWACAGHIVGCTCDIDWDALSEAEVDQAQNVLRNIARAEAAVGVFRADADRARSELRLILAGAQARRPNVMTVAASHLLNAWGRELGQAFPMAIGVLHVGSSFGREVDWRDVDVRIVLSDEDYDGLYRIADPKRLNVALSLWGERTTGLPIDCQVQPLRESRKYDDQPRNGIRA